MIYFSIIIPVFNEAKNIKNLIKEIYLYLKDYKGQFEIVIVDDCSIDNTSDILLILKKEFSLRIIKNLQNSGQSYSIYKGVKMAKHKLIITIDGDGQNHPKDILKLLETYKKNKNIKLISGIRQKRKDSIVKKLSSIMANKIRSKIFNDNCIDTGCSLKMFDKNIFLQFPFFNGIHRFIPTLFASKNLNIKYINVEHRQRLFGKSNYGTIDRLFKGIIDIIRVHRIIKNFNND